MGRCKFFTFYLVIFMNWTISSVAQSVSPVSPTILARIAGDATVGSDAYQYVKELTDNFGPRLTGSPQGARASQWALEKMKAMGLHNVHLEHWKLPRGWERGYAHGTLSQPVSRSLTVSSFGWAGSTPAGGIEAEVVPVPRVLPPEQAQKMSSQWTAKILFLLSDENEHADFVKDFAQLDRLVSAASAAGALAILAGEDRPAAAGVAISHTGPVAFNGAVYSIPVLNLTVEDRLEIL